MVHLRRTVNFSYLLPLAITRTTHDKAVHEWNNYLSVSLSLLIVFMMSCSGTGWDVLKRFLWICGALLLHFVILPTVSYLAIYKNRWFIEMKHSCWFSIVKYCKI